MTTGVKPPALSDAPPLLPTRITSTSDTEIPTNNAATAVARLYSERQSFASDTPYLSAFCDAETAQLQVLHATLQDISSRTKVFSQTGQLMSEAMRRLGQSCRRCVIPNHSERSGDGDAMEDPSASSLEQRDTITAQQRGAALGAEMATLLEKLGDVSIYAFTLSLCLLKDGSTVHCSP
jgi:hypothetical protein